MSDAANEGHSAEKDAGLTGVLATLRSINLQGVDWELRKLLAIREWAVEQIGIDYKVGDQVRIVSEQPSHTGGGWAAYSECLHLGATGTVTELDFSLGSDDRPGRWIATFMPDRQWSYADAWTKGGEPRRYWHGPVDETPEGYEPPGTFDQRVYPEGHRHTFMFRADWLTRPLPPGGSDA